MKSKILSVLTLLALLATFVHATPDAFAEDAPLAIVFDVSGSMNENDSSGTVKLATAKAAMKDLVQSRRGQRVGLWTYPGEGNQVDNCQAGGWVRRLSPSDNSDVTDVTAEIQMLTANGGTPTGPALKAAADSLRAAGYGTATIVLVSDGKSNCGTPPCEVAKSIVDSGFDLTVAAVAFDIEDGGGELECIANVTGGTFSDAKDSGELIKELEKLKPAALELSVADPETVRAGELMHFRVTVHNPSRNPVTDASLLISFSDRKAVPFVPAPSKRLATIPPGGTVEQVWTVGTRSGHTGKVDWVVLAGSQALGAVSRRGTVNLIDGDLKRGDGGVLLKHHGGRTVVLGDSYSSGEGAGDYEEDGEDYTCHRSRNAYGVDVEPDAVVIACSGATSPDLLGLLQTDKQPDQMNLLKKMEAPEIVFLTIGGNDIGFSEIVRHCFIGNCADEKDRQRYLERIERHPGFADTYEKIARAVNSEQMIKARGGVMAPVIVSPYPNPLWPKNRGQCNGNPGADGVIDAMQALWPPSWKNLGTRYIGFSPAEIEVSEKILAALNGKVEASVKEAAGKGWPVYFADSVEDFAVSHTICEEDSYFVRLTLENAAWRCAAEVVKMEKLQELFHPNKKGHRAWATRLITWSQRINIDEDAKPPSVQGGGVIDAIVRFGQRPIIPGGAEMKVTLGPVGEDGEYPAHDTEYRVTQDGKVNIRIEGLLPGTKVRVTVESEPQMLGNFTVAEDGTVEATVTLPELSTGGHQLVLEGYDTEYNLVGKRVPLQVDSGVPYWVLLAGLVLIATSLGTWLAVRKRRNLLHGKPESGNGKSKKKTRPGSGGTEKPEAQDDPGKADEPGGSEAPGESSCSEEAAEPEEAGDPGQPDDPGEPEKPDGSGSGPGVN